MSLSQTLLLGVETSCDETAASVVADSKEVLSNVVASQVNLHQKFGGVVPEIACRAHLESIIPVVDEALNGAGVELSDLTAIAVVNTPGLVGALLIGLSAAKALAWSAGIPLIGIDHLHAHVYVNFMVHEGIELPFVALVASGGHTGLYYGEELLDMRRLGGTIDDAAGEAFDKVASILGLGYPGGPEIEKLAREGEPTAIRFPRAFLGKDSYDFSFSGIKTAVLYHCRGQDFSQAEMDLSLDRQQLADVAASFQAAMVEVLVAKALYAAQRMRVKSLLLGGGVCCNRALTELMAEKACVSGVPLYFPPPELCMDNAVMVAGLGYQMLARGQVASLNLSAMPELQAPVSPPA